MPSLSRLIAVAVALSAATGLAGCGKAGGGKQTGPRLIYVSVLDCEAGEKINAADCGKAIEGAVAEHLRKSPKHPTMRDCEATEGPDRCERHGDREYRPRIMGYLLAQGEKVVAIPLYSGLKGATVFRDSGNKTYDWERTEGVNFSKEARRKAEGFQPLKKR